MVVSIAAAHGPSGTATIGSLNVAPNARDVIPGEVLLTIDLRHPEARVMSMMVGDMHAKHAIEKTAGRLRVEVASNRVGIEVAPRSRAPREHIADIVDFD